MSQTNKILAYMEKGKSITPMEALRLFGCMRLAARINDIRNMGLNVDCNITEVRNRDGVKCRVAKYKLAKRKAK